MSHKPIDVAVLNTIQALAADVVLSGGKLQLNDGSNDLLRNAIKLVDATASVKTSYTAGTASVKDYDFAGASFLTNSQYRMSIDIPGRIDFANGGGQEANQLITIREYIVWTGTVTPTADTLRDAFIARINADSAAAVTASANGAGVVRITLDDVAGGDFTTEAPTGVTEAVITPYVAPAGTPAIVEADAPTFSSPTGQYTTWRISLDDFRRHNAVNGGKVAYPEFINIYADETAANFAAFETEMDAVIAGTHTPVADYLGI